MAEGVNTFTIRAKDTEGNQAQATMTITVEWIPVRILAAEALSPTRVKVTFSGAVGQGALNAGSYRIADGSFPVTGVTRLGEAQVLLEVAGLPSGVDLFVYASGILDTFGNPIRVGTQNAPNIAPFTTYNLSSDGDGIPNYLDLDSDGDGYPDAVESASGSDPYDPASVPVAVPLHFAVLLALLLMVAGAILNRTAFMGKRFGGKT